MMWGYGIITLFWIVNAIVGQDGRNIHYWFWRTSQFTLLLTSLELIFTCIAWFSYGTRKDVLNSWIGYPWGTYVPATAGTGTWTNNDLTTNWTEINSDKAFLMWRDIDAVVKNATDYSLYGSLLNFGKDTYYLTATWLAVVSGLLDFLLIGLSWGVFNRHWYYENDKYVWESAPENAARAYDEFGCNAEGLNQYGYDCEPAVMADDAVEY
jgi:hypothetical protein